MDRFPFVQPQFDLDKAEKRIVNIGEGKARVEFLMYNKEGKEIIIYSQDHVKENLEKRKTALIETKSVLSDSKKVAEQISGIDKQITELDEILAKTIK